MKKFFYWTPRILSIAMACFISIFAFDVFEENNTAWETAVALFIHLLPTFVAVVIIIVAWKKEQIGGWLFIALGVTIMFLGRFQLVTILAVSFPLALVGAMFLAHYYKYGKGMKDSTTNQVE